MLSAPVYSGVNSFYSYLNKKLKRLSSPSKTKENVENLSITILSYVTSLVGIHLAIRTKKCAFFTRFNLSQFSLVLLSSFIKNDFDELTSIEFKEFSDVFELYP